MCCASLKVETGPSEFDALGLGGNHPKIACFDGQLIDLAMACRVEVHCQYTQGLDCDVVRALFSGGLDLLTADIVVDGHYHFLVFMVRPLPGISPGWKELSRSLKHIVQVGVNLRNLLHAREENHTEVHKITVASQDHIGAMNEMLSTLGSHGLDVVQSQVRCAQYSSSDTVEQRLEATFCVYDRCDRILGEDRWKEVEAAVSRAAAAPDKASTASSITFHRVELRRGIWPPQPADSVDSISIAEACGASGACTMEGPLHEFNMHAAPKLSQGSASWQSLLDVRCPPSTFQRDDCGALPPWATRFTLLAWDPFLALLVVDTVQGLPLAECLSIAIAVPRQVGSHAQFVAELWVLKGADVASQAQATVHEIADRSRVSHAKTTSAGRDVFVNPAWRTANEHTTISIDHTLSHDAVCITIECADRKGLLYDLLRTTHSLNIMVTQARTVQKSEGCVEVHLFLKDSGGQPLAGGELLRPLLHRLQKAVLQPVHVLVRALPAVTCASAKLHLHVSMHRVHTNTMDPSSQEHVFTGATITGCPGGRPALRRSSWPVAPITAASRSTPAEVRQARCRWSLHGSHVA
jgi:hypothetical protein